jgi:hypothetical protein
MKAIYASFISCIVLLSSSAVMAEGSSCKLVPTLAQGFNMDSYEACRAKIAACPKRGPYIDTVCVRKVMANESACNSLMHLASSLQVAPNAISVQQKGNLDLLDIRFLADGGHLYYILNPKGCLIATNVDPRSLSARIKQQYAKANFYVEAHKPEYSHTQDLQRFKTNLALKNQCRACALLGSAQVNFDFNAEGDWVKTSLIHFAAR